MKIKKLLPKVIKEGTKTKQPLEVDTVWELWYAIYELHPEFKQIYPTAAELMMDLNSAGMTVLSD